MKVNKEYYYVFITFIIYFLIGLLDTFFAENTFDYELKDKTLVDIIHNNFRGNYSQSIPNNLVFFILLTCSF